MRQWVTMCLPVVITLFVAVASGARSASASTVITYFPATGHTLRLGFASFVDAHGGVGVFGYPITEEIDSSGTSTQYFERFQLEWQRGRSVTAVPIGVELGKATPAVPASSDPAAIYYFSTGHSLGGDLLAYYATHGGAALFGLPISEPESLDSGTIQYFQNAELDDIPGKGIEPGNLGFAAAESNGWQVQAPPLASIGPPDLQTRARGEALFDGGGTPASLMPSYAASTTSAVINGRARVAVLAYHHIGNANSVYATYPAEFSRQLAWLQDNGYTTLSYRDLVNAVIHGGQLPSKPVVITIDDGYADAFTTAVPILLQFHATATFFIPTRVAALTPDQLRQMDQWGFDIEAHSRTHPELTKLSSAPAWSQLAGSKSDLEAILGHSITMFAYPYGAFNTSIVRLAHQAGYVSVAGAGEAWVVSNVSLYNEPRIVVDRGDSLANFIAKVTGAAHTNTLRRSEDPLNVPAPSSAPALAPGGRAPSNSPTSPTS